ncbi:ankyrin repeat domain-containing protein [bacterium]|nr:ankyrin repeat domain-containing protein [bacterium]
MKYIRFLLFVLFFSPASVMAAQSDFMVAAQLLSAAKNADIAQVELLVNNGADVNFVDSTGLSIVCTALMNNDVRAAQILQMYGADASQCDKQIKKYNSRNKQERSGGLFSGLSSAHTLTLAAAGAAVVVGGLLLLTDAFDGGGSHSSSGGSGDRPNNGGGDDNSGGGTATAKITLPYGPAMPNAESEAENYTANLDYYSPSVEGILKDNFAFMSNSQYQNYLLMMHGYSPLARGYLGQRTLRLGTAPYTAYPLKDASGNYLYVLDGSVVQGGRPVNVSVISQNGINAAPNTSLGEWDETLGRWDVLLYSEVNGTVLNPASKDRIYSKYYNNAVTSGASLADSTVTEDPVLLENFDLAGMGTVIHNNQATLENNLLAQIVGGKDAGYTDASFFGFMPNGQMTVFRTGGGTGMKSVSGTPQTGSYVMAGGSLADNDTITLFGKTMKIQITSPVGNDLLTFNATEVLPDGSTETPTKYTGYIGTDGLLYIDAAADGKISQAYALKDGVLTQTKEIGTIDYYNYKALRKSGALWFAGDLSGGRSLVDVIANASVVPALRMNGAKNIDDVLSLGADNTVRNAGFISYVNQYYNRDDTDGYVPGVDAQSFFTELGSTYFPLVLFSTGASDTGNSGYLGRAEVASFENAAPLVFANLDHLFMSVVAVGLQNGTSNAKTVSGYLPSSSYKLAQWQDQNGTPDNTADDKYYKARVCGVAGQGAEGVDPWCFASAGITDELAVASAAGAVGAVKSAFAYMNNKQLFTLLALTADGPYLGTSTDGNILSKDTLRGYLQGMYELPNEYAQRVTNGEEYLDVFKEVFGYGLINLERATKPGTNIYFYDGSKIVSASGNAYWRAASGTQFRMSSAFGGRGASISAPFFDVLESADGDLRLPRVWENEFSLGASRRRGLYMTDVFDDLKIDVSDNSVEMGDLRFSMTTSPRMYSDNMGGLDTMHLGLSRGNWELDAGYQHRFTDGAGLFSGMANPIMSLASDAMHGDARYSMGRWNFGMRAFSGAITDDTLLENDPTVSAEFAPARLGLMHGAAFTAGWGAQKLNFDTSIGILRETDTILGAQTGGLLALGGGDTSYIDMIGRYNFADNISMMARGTFARTTADPSGQYIMGLSAIDSDAFAIGMKFGGLELVAARPLAVTSGRMRYSYAEYDVTDSGDGRFDIAAIDSGVRSLDLRAGRRETRLTGMYHHALGAFTDGAVGLVYRINPDNTDEFGNETVFMFKLHHRIGI